MRELPEGWAEATLEDIAQWGSGGTPSRKNSEYYDGLIPWIKTGELNQKIIVDTEEKITDLALQNSSAKIFPKGSVAVAMYGATIGKTSILGMDAATNQVCAVGIPNLEITTTEYLWHYLSSQKEDFIEAGKGGAQPNISQGVVKEWPLPLPPLNEQKRIADRLDQLLTRIDKIKAHLDRILPLLKRFRQSVLAAATSGKLTEEWREEYVIEKLGLNSIAELKLNDDYLFDLPAGWKWVKLTDIANYKSGVAFKSNEFSNSGTQVIRLGNVYQGKLDLSRDPIFMKVVSDKANTLRSKSIVVSQTGTRHKRDYGYFVMIPEDAPPLLLNQRLLAIMTSPATIAKYVVLASNTIAYKEFFFSQETGGVNQGNVGIAGVMQGPIPLPPIKEQQEIVRRVEALFAKADRIEAQYKNARQQVDRLTPALLAKAFRGELVPQDPNDEPASVLLERVKEARSM